MMDTILYERDFHAWALEQASALRKLAEERVNLPLDLPHLIEEVEDMANNELDVVEGNLTQVILHLLKLEWSAEVEPRRHWMVETASFRANALRRLKRSPTVQGRIDLPGIYADAREQFVGMRPDNADIVPQTSPYTVDQLLQRGWFPINRHGISDEN